LPSFSIQITGGWGAEQGASDSSLLIETVHVEDFGPTYELDPKRRNSEGNIFHSTLLVANADFDKFGTKFELDPK